MIKRVLIKLKNNMYYKYISFAIKRRFAKIFRKKRLISCLIINCISLIILLVFKYYFKSGYIEVVVNDMESNILEVTNLEDHNLTIERYFGIRKHWITSNLGSLLFKNEKNRFKQKDKTFIILMWKYWDWLQKRHVESYGPSIRFAEDVLKECSVNNCVFTGDNKTINTVDAVVVHIMHGVFPKVDKRNRKQIWIFLTDEAPPYTFNMARGKIDVRKWANVFNWSMTYKSKADVPVPYGRTVPLKAPVWERVTYEAIAELIPNLQFKRTDVLVAVYMSNCKVKNRNQYLNALRKHIKIDVYGNCGVGEKQKMCDFTKDCPVLDQYFFYLVMENKMCSQYITQKTFFNGYTKGAIPVLVGTFLTDSKKILPPNSYINSGDYKSLKALAAKINGTIKNTKEYLSYHLWRNHFEVKNEHGYFGTKSYHLCRICEALNYNVEKTKVYSFKNLRRFLDPSLLCKDVKVPEAE